MARQVDKKERQMKSNEILDCAQKLVYTTGYEQMSIQDICIQLGISKGAFYHYFDSKPALLEALIERTSQQAITLLVPIVEDPSLHALEKLEKFFSSTNRWKVSQKDFFLELIKIWYADENAIVRQKLTDKSMREFSTLLNRIIQQGVNEGAFNPAYPEMAGLVALTLMTQMGESLIPLIIETNNQKFEGSTSVLQRMQKVVNAFTDAVERILGTPTGSIKLFDLDTLEQWLPETPNKGPILALQKEEQG